MKEQDYKDAQSLLEQLISIRSFSKEENNTADLLESFFAERNFPVHRKYNNVYVEYRDEGNTKPVILLNSHHDTVRFSEGWHTDPLTPTLKGDKLIGLGANDAGGSLVALCFTFLELVKNKNLPFDLILALTAEEEISGAHGVESILPDLGKIDLGIVGEPTALQMAVSERGLMVVDVLVKGESGHAARNNGVNAIYKTMPEIEWIRNYTFEKSSPYLGDVKMTVTQIEAGLQHNVIPDSCKYIVDVRLNDCYTPEEVLQEIEKHSQGKVAARSMRLKPSAIDPSHPFVKHAIDLGIELFGSSTLSDQALMPFPTVKIGPGDSERSHTANEYITIPELRQGMDCYYNLLSTFSFDTKKAKT